MAGDQWRTLTNIDFGGGDYGKTGGSGGRWQPGRGGAYQGGVKDSVGGGPGKSQKEKSQSPETLRKNKNNRFPKCAS